MDNSIDPFEWIKRAKSNLILGKNTKLDDENLWDDVYLEDLCYYLQQSAEKSLKAILVLNNINFPYTHSISELIDLLVANSINVPVELYDAVILTPFAVRSKYPGDWIKINDKEYEECVNITEKVYNWAKQQLKN